MSADTLVVTGLSSFLGTHLARAFARKGHRVLGTLTRSASEYDALRGRRIRAAEQSGVDVRTLDVTAAGAVREFVAREKPAVWVHHAGWATEYCSPAYDLDRGHAVNVAPLRALYEALVTHDCRGVLITGSSMEYADSDRPAREDDACWPTTPYGLSKLAETLQARQLAGALGLRTRAARVFVPYGPLDDAKKLIPDVIRALRAGESVDLSPCEQARDFLHVDDLARGYEALVADLGRDQAFDLFNLCSGQATPLKQLLLELARTLGADPGLLHFGKRALRPGEPPVSYGANDKARTLLGWQARPLREGLRAYLEDAEEGPV